MFKILEFKNFNLKYHMEIRYFTIPGKVCVSPSKGEDTDQTETASSEAV